jgi:hypothetical protein
MIWFGMVQEFVAHDGVSFSGVNEVITYMGVTATLDHKVLLTNGRWEEIEAAARNAGPIASALGAEMAASLSVNGSDHGRSWSTSRSRSSQGFTFECAAIVVAKVREEFAIPGDRSLFKMQALHSTASATKQEAIV